MVILKATRFSTLAYGLAHKAEKPTEMIGDFLFSSDAVTGTNGKPLGSGCALNLRAFSCSCASFFNFIYVLCREILFYLLFLGLLFKKQRKKPWLLRSEVYFIDYFDELERK
ncbi:hypothetical protein C1646_663134 [Rhizophagus diaphanus]|nr:hypothetical protein C1646_663134 [Rhizophagus diaphanus] [Rhizophagus sp. MUCL 43196]